MCPHAPMRGRSRAASAGPARRSRRVAVLRYESSRRIRTEFAESCQRAAGPSGGPCGPGDWLGPTRVPISEDMPGKRQHYVPRFLLRRFSIDPANKKSHIFKLEKVRVAPGV